MKKLTALLLCFLLLCTCNVFAKEVENEITDSVISTTVPDAHKITVTAEDANVFYEGICGEEFSVGRLSEPRLLIRADSGKVIKSVTINGEDVTSQIVSGYLTLKPVYEDKIIAVTAENEPEAPKNTYTVRGKITLNGEPLSEVDLELRSTLKVTKTDKDGCFIFKNVEVGKHSLTALSNGKVIGYLSFELEQNDKVDVSFLEDGAYRVLIDQKGAGVELNLVLNEEFGTMAVSKVIKISKADTNIPSTGDVLHLSWWIWLLISAGGIACIETYHRKKLK